MILETVVTSLDDARAAVAGGADRFELCSALALGGLTPSLGTLQSIKGELGVPVMCMIRPREGGMAYTAGEVAAMSRDAELAIRAGADGVVFGFLTSGGEIDELRCRAFVDHVRAFSATADLVFHRAFDVVLDPAGALEQLIGLGITRVLTSGRAKSALDGAPEIRRTLAQARGRLEVLPGGGITADDVAAVIRATGANQVHVYVTRVDQDLSTSANPLVSFGAHVPASELERRVVSEAGVREIRRLLDAAGGTERR
jgi:copper homeostasis protein